MRFAAIEASLAYWSLRSSHSCKARQKGGSLDCFGEQLVCRDMNEWKWGTDRTSFGELEPQEGGPLPNSCRRSRTVITARHPYSVATPGDASIGLLSVS